MTLWQQKNKRVGRSGSERVSIYLLGYMLAVNGAAAAAYLNRTGTWPQPIPIGPSPQEEVIPLAA
jgi:hypothetical protein